MDALDQESNGITNFSAQRRSANSVDAEIARMNEELGFVEPKDLKPPFIPGETKPPEGIQPPAEGPAPASENSENADPTGLGDFANKLAENPDAANAELTPEQRKKVHVPEGMFSKTDQAIGGVYDVFKNLGQTAVDVADGVDNWLQKKGLTETDFIEDDYKFDPLSGLVPPPSTPGERTARGVGKFAAQFGAFIAGGSFVQGGKIAMMAGGMASGAAVNFAAFDPHEERLSNLVQEYPSLANPISEYLAAKPGDSQMEGRFKNAIEGVLGDAALSLAFVGIAKGYKLMRASKVAPEVTLAGKAAATAENTVTPSTQLGPEGSPLGGEFTPGVQAPRDVANGDLNPGAVPAAPEAPSRAAVAETEMKTLTTDQVAEAVPQAALVQSGNIKLSNIDTSMDVKAVLANVIKHNKTEIESVTRGVVPDAKVTESAVMIASDEASRLLNFKVGQAMNAEELVATKILTEAAAKDLLELSEKAILSGLDEDIAAAARAQGILNQWFGQLAGGTAEAGRTLRAAGQNVGSGLVERAAAAKNLIEFSGGKEEVLKNLSRINQILKQPNIDKAKYLAMLAQRATYKKFGDAVFEVWINGLLSSTGTLMKNFVANSSTLVMHPLEKMNAWAIGAARNQIDTKIKGLAPNKDRVSIGEVGHTFIGLWEGLMDGLTLAGKADKAGLAIKQGGKLEPMYKAISSEAWGAQGAVAQGLDVMGSIVRLPGKALQVTDDFFKGVNYRMEVQALAARDSELKGLVGEAYQQNLTKNLENPPEWIQLSAQARAKEATFTKDLKGAMKKFDDGLKELPFNMGKIVSPFVRVNVNMVEFTMARNPLLAPFSSAFKAELKQGGAVRDVALGKVAFGTTMMGMGAYLASSGVITGGGPADKKAFNALKETGWQPYSVQIGDTFVSYESLEGVAPLFKMAADAVQLFPYLEDEQLKDDLVLAAGFMLGNAVTPDFLTSSVAPALLALRNPETDGAKFIQSLTSSVVPGIVKQVNRTFVDPVKRDTRVGKMGSIWDQMLNNIKAGIPGLSDDLPPQQNFFGDDIVYPDGAGPTTLSAIALVSPAKITSAKNDRVLDEIVRLGMAGALTKEEPPAGQSHFSLDLPPRSFTINNIPVNLTPMQYHRFQKLSAGHGLGKVQGEESLTPTSSGKVPTLYDAMRLQIKKFDSEKSSDEKRKVVLKAITRSYRAAAKAQLIDEDPTLRQVRIQGAAARGSAFQLEGPGISGNNAEGDN